MNLADDIEAESKIAAQLLNIEEFYMGMRLKPVGAANAARERVRLLKDRPVQ